MLAGFPFLAGESQEPPWVVGLPEHLAVRLRAVPPGDIARLATSWREAFDPTNAPSPSELATVLRDLTGFLQRHDPPFALHIGASSKTGSS